MSNTSKRIADLTSEQRSLLQLRIFQTPIVAEFAEAIVQRRGARAKQDELTRLPDELEGCSGAVRARLLDKAADASWGTR